MERAIAAVRIGSALYCVAVFAGTSGDVANPALGWGVAGGVLGWTAFAVWVQVLAPQLGRSVRGGLQFAAADIAVVLALTLLTITVQTHVQRTGDTATLTTVWAVCPALTAGACGGVAAGLLAAAAQAAASVVVRQGADSTTVSNIVLLLLAGTATGYLARLASRAEAQAVAAAAQRAAVSERERLARDIHDGVLQVLSLVHRRGAELGGGAGELARLAGEQEAILRQLITRPEPERAAGAIDLAAACAMLRATRVTVSTPAHPVLLDRRVASELIAATRAALDNVSRHAGPDARAWVLLEDAVMTATGEDLVLTIRDDGVGVSPEQLARAAANDRIGIAQSIMARLEAIGGSATVGPAVGGGAEVELRVPCTRALS